MKSSLQGRGPTREVRRAGTWLAAGVLLSGGGVQANPVGMTVAGGSATAVVNGNQLTIRTSPLTVLNWQSFNIQPGETTTFLQPGATSIVISRINDSNPSAIFGSLQANGTVILENQHGFYFGPNSSVIVGGNFVATTASLPPEFASGGGWQFNGPPPLASIVNYGTIQTRNGGSLFLIAERIENHGSLIAPDGTIGLYAGKEVLLSERPDGRGLSAKVTLPEGSVDNTGSLIANAGNIAVRAQVVNQNGLVQADSIRSHNGVIELVAANELNLGANSQILARGDDSGASPGGVVTLQSGGGFQDTPTSRISVAGGSLGGAGGQVEVSAENFRSFSSVMEAGAQSGWAGGSLLLDPQNITLGTSGAGTVGSGGQVDAGTGSGTLALNVNTAFAGQNFSRITLAATANITLAAGTTWNLGASTGVSAVPAQLTLAAGGNILFQNNSAIVDGNNWSVNLLAGYNFATQTVQPGIGSIFLNGGSGLKQNGAIQTAAGGVTLAAGKDVLVGTGYVRTVGGGSISISALTGDINAGTKNDGYDYSVAGYALARAGLGQIATAAGGDVTLQAGNNVISLPTTPANTAPGASGAYGSQPGNVTVSAGNQILGNYLVRNGQGILKAGVSLLGGTVTSVLNPAAAIGSATQPVALSLIAGSWSAYAAGDIFVSEVRNPNGMFNPSKLTVPAGSYAGNADATGFIAPPARQAFQFDYAPDAGVSLWAGNGITLVGANLPRVNNGSGSDLGMPAIYPPRLALDAGAGGITINNTVVLYPSAQGGLSIITRDGGNLSGTQQQSTLTGINMSDSGLPDYHTFVSGHAASPLHLNDPNPVTVDVSGSIESFGLTVPTAAVVKVTHDAYNFGFAGQNLSPTATTSIAVGGNLNYRGNLTSVTLADALPGDFLNSGLSAAPDVTARLRYDSAGRVLSYVGQMSASAEAFLLHPSILAFDSYGQPVLDPVTGSQTTTPVPLTAGQQTAIQQLYAASQNATLGDQGLAVAGPGRFSVRAQNIDLGISGGISVLAPTPALAAISPLGAALEITLPGNLEMSSTKILNEGLGGGIELQAGGRLDLGSQSATFGDAGAARGIFTTSGGNVSVIANGTVNVDGSRIAAFNGGNVLVRSLAGDINAGAGGGGFVTFTSLALDPITGHLISYASTIPGSGILATTPVGSTASVGNIVVDAPQGSIIANYGGIEQIAFNGLGSPDHNFIDLTAHLDINASDSGILGYVRTVDAGRNVNGLIVSLGGNLAINAGGAFSGVAFSPGGLVINSAGTISGTIIGGDNVSVSGSAISATVIAKSATTSGDTTGAKVGIPASNVAREASRTAEEAAAVVAKESDPAQESDSRKKREGGTSPGLAKSTGRVTVILPTAP